MAVTIREVAQAAGVSASTVSRVVTDDSRISEPTRQKVRKAMADLGYHPNAIARSLVRQASSTIGLVMSRPPRTAMAIPFYPEIIGGITEVATMSKYHVLLVSSTSREDESAQALSLLRNRKVEGIIHLASRVHDKLIDALVEEQFPFVVIGRVPNKQVPCVNNDNIAAARLAVSHLLQEGFRRIAFIGGSPDLVVTCDRLDGYHQAMKAGEIHVRPEWVSCSESSIEAGAEVTERLLAQTPQPDAIFAMDDTIAAGALKAATKLGRRIPDDLALVGFNDDPVSSFVEPALTTVRIPIFEMGCQAARMLIEMIHSGKAPENVVVPAELVIRQSSLGRSEGSSRVDKEGLAWEERSAPSARVSGQK